MVSLGTVQFDRRNKVLREFYEIGLIKEETREGREEWKEEGLEEYAISVGWKKAKKNQLTEELNRGY